MELKIDDKFETRRGNLCVIIDGYKFSKSREMKDENIYFRCTNHNCKSSVVICKYIKQIISVNNEHNHPPISNSIINRQKLTSTLKRKATSDIFNRPNKIIRQTLQTTVVDIPHSDIRLFRKSMYEARMKKIPTLPKNIVEATEQMYNHSTELKQSNGEQFCYMKIIDSIPIFTCISNLKLLIESSHVFADSTFSYAPKFFLQMYTVHIWKNEFYVPVIYAFLKSKSTEMYSTFWTTIKNLCLELLGQSLEVKFLHLDFEQSAHISAKNVFPNCRIIGCRFHLHQSWFRKIQSSKFLLKHYTEKTDRGLASIFFWLEFFTI